MNRSARKYTNQLWDLINDELIDKDRVLGACLSYMSEQEVQDMCESEGFIESEDEE